MARFNFQPHDLPESTESLRDEVRDFLARELAD